MGLPGLGFTRNVEHQTRSEAGSQMQRTTITVGTRRWDLASAHDIDMVKAAVLGVIDDGAGFVSLPTSET